MCIPLFSLSPSIQAKRSGRLASNLTPDGLARVWLASALLLSTSLASAQGITVAIGGGLKDDNLAVWSRLGSLAGGAGSRFTVFATASGDPERTASRIAANLKRHGAVVEVAEVAPRWCGRGHQRGRGRDEPARFLQCARCVGGDERPPARRPRAA
jgi:hypothetical protein